jgi:hypothetical protein
MRWTIETCEARYPHLIRAMQWAAILSRSEAAAAIRDWKNGMQDGGGEAVMHFGGIFATIEAAIRLRRYARLTYHG